MARSRNIKPGFFTNDGLAELPALTRLLFIGLWTIADRAGRLEDRPKRIKAEVLPYDDCDIDAMLADLDRLGFIQRYEAAGACAIQIVTWDKHQNPHIKESESTIPAPCEHRASTVLAGKAEQPSTELARLIPDSGFLIPDSKEEQPSAPPEPKKDEPIPLSLDDLFAEGVTREAAKEWLAVRRRKKAGPVTPLAWSGFKAQAVKAGWGFDAAVRKCVERNWVSFEADWVQSNTGETLREKRARERQEEMTGGLASAKPPGQPKLPGVFDVLAIGMD
jgi:hypothetical protein